MGLITLGYLVLPALLAAPIRVGGECVGQTTSMLGRLLQPASPMVERFTNLPLAEALRRHFPCHPLPSLSPSHSPCCNSSFYNSSAPRSWPDWSTTPTTVKRDERVTRKVDSSICATLAKRGRWGPTPQCTATQSL